MKKWIPPILFLLIFLKPEHTFAQRFLMDLVDTTNQMGKGMLSIYERYNRVRISGYIQPQFQYIGSKGAESFAGGNFSEFTDNRFMLRRGRLRVDYAHLNDKAEPTSYFVFQFDGTERGVVIRDFWGRFYENKFKLFAITTGMFARPFGFEVNLSSANRETPERGRMSQILMRTERDIGVMLTLNKRLANGKISDFKFDIGIFNGQGISGPVDYDSHKDIIAKISMKPKQISDYSRAQFSAAISGYAGGITSQSAVLYKVVKSKEQYVMLKDSSQNNLGKAAPRNYAGADAQLIFPSKRWQTEFRAEYITGNQTATALNSETPGSYPLINGMKAPLYVRNFDGAYFYFLQNLNSDVHQFVMKYDWYDPNKKVSGQDVNTASGFSKADLRYNTLGVGYVYRANPSLKFTFYYENVKNEKSQIPGFLDDADDDVLTCRVQYNF
ncbi:porin [Dyadobacter sp. CY345]|uniref:porin n=1 Tax=Dyadobacter sp. CY345 TaxID=2909335 RepID=UPI001F311C99|nr:porin [Dyadobacter sp. CY345]MCF2446479.1 porin [Dyadobacter sp. CY345]